MVPRPDQARRVGYVMLRSCWIDPAYQGAPIALANNHCVFVVI